MKKAVGLPLIVLLSAIIAGCSTPRQTCIAEATRDYRDTRKAIAEIEQNLARGYALHRERVPYTSLHTCFRRDPLTWALLPYPCSTTHYRIQTTPVAIDAALEQRKLMEHRRALPKLQARAEAGTRQCEAQFPEEG